MDTVLTIPKLTDGTTFYKIYVYISNDKQDIDTISKVRDLQPDIIIDETIAVSQNTPSHGDCYVIPGNIFGDVVTPPPGVTYNNHSINILPSSMYETLIDVVKINNATYTSKLTLNNIYTSTVGIMLYYSCIGINEATNQITHLSKVSGVRVNLNLQQDAQKYLYSCDNYTGESTDVWTPVAVCSWDEKIVIGDLSDSASYTKFGNPFISTVPIFKNEDVRVSLKPVNSQGTILLSFPNPWRLNNVVYNYRKLKSYKIQNYSNNRLSDPSEPTFQSTLPLSIEKVLIFCKEKAQPGDSPVPYSSVTNLPTGVTCRQVIRKGGIYYTKKEYRGLGFNKFNIGPTEDLAFFNESSTQEEIKMHTYIHPGVAYQFTIYLIDVYGNVSAPATTYVQV